MEESLKDSILLRFVGGSGHTSVQGTPIASLAIRLVDCDFDVGAFGKIERLGGMERAVAPTHSDTFFCGESFEFRFSSFGFRDRHRARRNSPIERLMGQPVRFAVLLPWDVLDGEVGERGRQPASALVELAQREALPPVVPFNLRTSSSESLRTRSLLMRWVCA